MNIHEEKIKTYKKDGRMPINEVYNSYSRLKESLWINEVICSQKIGIKGQKYLPIRAYRTRKKGPALWLISGIHGEEPAGVNAIAKNTKYINKLAKKIPLVLLPLCNPSGYARNWRYPTAKKSVRNKPAPSVGDSEHYLLNKKGKARAKKPLLREAEEITSFVIHHSKKYPPLIVLDFHEDESAKKLYIYSQGKLKNYDPIARKVVNVLRKEGYRLYEKGKTSFGEKIIKGVVSNIEDGSIDELLSSERIIVNGKIRKGPNAKSVVVIETKTVDIPLKKRVRAHSYILKSSKNLYLLAKDIFSESWDKE